MNSSVAKVIEISSQSTEGFDHAIKQGIEQANKTLNNVKSIWIKDQNVVFDQGTNQPLYRAHMKVTFELED